VNLPKLIVRRPGVELTISKSQVHRPYHYRVTQREGGLRSSRQVSSGEMRQVVCHLVCASWTRAWPQRAVRASDRTWRSRWRSVRTASPRCTRRPAVLRCQPPQPPPLKRTQRPTTDADRNWPGTPATYAAGRYAYTRRCLCFNDDWQTGYCMRMRVTGGDREFSHCVTTIPCA